MPTVHAQPLINVADVAASCRWYEALLGVRGSHGGDEYDRLMAGDELVLQLHSIDQAHHHGRMANSAVALGNGVAIWFGAEDFDATAQRARDLGATVETDVHRNPNSGALELWLRDPDGYLVVVASWPSG